MTALDTFVHDALSAGKSRDQISGALKTAGWEDEEIIRALSEYAEEDFSVPVPRKHPHPDAYDAFMHLIEFVTLFTCAMSIGVIVFQVLNLFLPEPASRSDSYEFARSAIYGELRGAAAALIICLPIFALVVRRLSSDYRADSARRTSPVRKWLTYMSLFIASMHAIGYLIWLVTLLLGGELSVNCTLKVITVLVISGAVFGLYLPAMRRDETVNQHELGTAH